MPLRVQPNEPRKQFPLTLTDLNGNELGLLLCDAKGNLIDTSIRQAASPASVMRISQGAPGYTDFELPYTPILQDSWSGGRGAKNFEQDTTRYAQSLGVDTSNGNIILAPIAYQLRTSVTSANNYTVGTSEDRIEPANTNYHQYYLTRFVVPANMTIQNVKMTVSNNAGALPARAVIYGETGGLPGTLLAAGNYVSFTNQVLDQVEVNFPINLAVTANQVIYIGLQNGSYFLVCPTSRNGAGVGTTYTGDGTTWTATFADRVLKIDYSADGLGQNWFFKYHGVTYCVKNYNDGSGVRLFRNGYHGFAQTGSTKELVNTTWGITGLSTGKVLSVLAGTGARQEVPYRRGIQHTNNFVPDHAFDITPDTTSEIAIDGLGNPAETVDGDVSLIEITGHGLTNVVGQPLVINDVVYFPQGPGANIRKMRLNAAAYEFADNGTDKADYLITCPKTTGGYQVWSAMRDTGIVRRADAVAWGTNLTFADSNGGKSVSSRGSKITNLIAYGTPTMPFILKEDGFGNINNDVYADMPINNMIEKMGSLMNGRCAAVSDVYLFFSMVGGRVERFYDQHLDDVGVDRDEGLPHDQQGEVSGILTIPGRWFISIDAGEQGYSGVYQNNGRGWHEIYRAASVGTRIRGLAYQDRPDQLGRILFTENGKVMAMDFSIAPDKVNYPNEYYYCTSGWIQSARIYGSMRDVRKFFKGLTLFSENLLTTGPQRTIEVEYRTDEDPDTWKSAVEIMDTSMIDKTDFSLTNDVAGRWIEYRLTLNSYVLGTDTWIGYSPVVDAVLLDTITRTPPKDQWTLYFLLGDQLRDQQDNLIALDALDYLTQLNQWADSRLTPWPLRMYSMIPSFNDRLVVIEPPSVSPIDVTVIGDMGEDVVVQKMLGQIRVMAV